MMRRPLDGVCAAVIAAAAALLAATTAQADELMLRVGDASIPPGTIVNGNAVVIGGTLDVGGTVTGSATAAGGSVHVSGHVGGDVRAAGGNVILGPTAVVDGTVQATGGSVRVARGAVIRKAPPGLPAPPIPSTPQVPPVPPYPVPPYGTPPPSPMPWFFPGMPSWMPPAILGVIAAWKVVAGLLLLLGLVTFVGTAWITAALFPGVTATVTQTLERNPAASAMAGALVWLLIGPVIVLLFLSVAGVLLVLVLLAALLIAIQLGFSAVAVLVGHRVRPGQIALEAVIGGLFLAIASAIPHLGWLAGFAAVTWGTGGVIMAIVERRHHGSLPPPPPPAPATPVV